MRFLKHKLCLVMLALTSTMGVAACSEDDDNDLKNVPVQYTSALQVLFPKAKQVDWEQEGTYKVAEFYHEGYETDVWFDAQAQWVMTQTDYKNNVNLLPTAVANAFNQSQYAACVVDDVDGYQRKDATFYVIEVEMPGKADQDIYINSDGEITQVLAENVSYVTPTSPIM